jgi:hypothetical protein
MVGWHTKEWCMVELEHGRMVHGSEALGGEDQGEEVHESSTWSTWRKAHRGEAYTAVAHLKLHMAQDGGTRRYGTWWLEWRIGKRHIAERNVVKGHMVKLPDEEIGTW